MEEEPKSARQAVSVPEEFLIGNTVAGLGKLRTRLLDLTARNRLLNFRHTSASSLRVVDVHLDSVFGLLMDGRELSFLPVPNPPGRESDGALLFDEGGNSTRGSTLIPPPAEYAKSIGWNTSFDLGNDSGWEQEGSLPVLHYLEKFESLSRKISSAATAAIEESGTNMLYLTFGFLEWYESDDSNQPRLAPLLTLPVTIDRYATKSKGFQCTIEYSGEDFSTNLSLLEKLKADFGFAAPTVEESETPSSYFRQFQPILQQKPRWKIRPQLTLSVLGFGKLLMYRDLDPENWPGIAQHQIVRDFFEGSKAERVEHAPEYMLDEHDPPEAVPPIILDAERHAITGL